MRIKEVRDRYFESWIRAHLKNKDEFGPEKLKDAYENKWPFNPTIEYLHCYKRTIRLSIVKKRFHSVIQNGYIRLSYPLGVRYYIIDCIYDEYRRESNICYMPMVSECWLFSVPFCAENDAMSCYRTFNGCRTRCDRMKTCGYIHYASKHYYHSRNPKCKNVRIIFDCHIVKRRGNKNKHIRTLNIYKAIMSVVKSKKCY